MTNMTSTSSCANCETELSGLFCSNCGQSSKSRRGPIWNVSAEFMHDLFALDSKVLQSLFRLLVKPGVLTKQFLDGKRASVLPPVRLYLVISILFFFVFQIPTPDVSKDNVYIGNILLGHESPIDGAPNYQIFHFGEENRLNTWFEDTFKEQIIILKNADAQLSVEKIFNSLEEILPKVLIFFLPLFALVLKFLYAFKRILYFDHLIFSLHFQTWLMGAVLIIYGLALQNAWWSALSIFVPIYLAKAQKLAYQQTYWLVIPKTLAILVTYLVLIVIAGLTSFLSAIAML